ncbi:hypothetical protein B0H21DRAFT_732820 [Amylocystis lapponica]|nr:hypothetical protein B0H21DRAFT_732820 [Amylocystis lapponica]
MTSDFAHLQQYAPVDPYYETYTDKRGRERRRRVSRAPPGLNARDTKILRSVKRRAHYLDRGFNLCGLRFGWTFVVGVVPGLGDVADAVLNYVLVVRKARQADIPDWLLRRMLMNNAVSIAVGFVPIAGDVVLAVYKANWRNAALLEEFLRIRGAEVLRRDAERADAGAVVSVPEPVRRGSSWWGKMGKGKGKGKQPEPVPGSGARPLSVAGTDRGHFVEDVPESGDVVPDIPDVEKRGA